MDPRIYPSLPVNTPVFNKFICATLPESTPHSQNIPPFSTTICDPSGIYPSQNIRTSFSTNLYVRPSQNLPLPPRIFNNYMRHSQRLPPPSQNAPPFSTTIGICDTSRIYPSRPDYTPPSQNIHLLPFLQLYIPKIYPPVTPQSLNYVYM